MVVGGDMFRFCNKCDKPTDHFLYDPILMRYQCDICNTKKGITNANHDNGSVGGNNAFEEKNRKERTNDQAELGSG